MVQLVCLDAEKHAVSMMTELQRMKQDNDHCDFLIQVGDDVYRTHKNVLSAGSAYFNAMLKHKYTKESREGKVVLKDVDSQCVKNCIDFIYSAKFQIPEGKIIELLHAAIMMQLEDIKIAVSNILAKSITAENYFSTRNVGDIYGLADVSSKCRIFLQEHIMEIANQDGFGSVEKNDLLRLMKSRGLKLCEEEKLTLSLKWIDKSESKSEYLHEYLEVIKFDQIPSVYLQRILETHPLISNDFELYKLINRHILTASAKAKEDCDTNKLIILFDLGRKCLQSFNPISKEVEKFHDAKIKLSSYITATSLDSYIYVLCGKKSVYRLNFLDKYSKWGKMDDMICDHGKFPRSVCATGSIFVIGGSEYRKTTDVERFDPSVNRWFQLENKPSAICDAGLISLNDSIYCVGGRGQDGDEVSAFCKFSLSSAEWVDLEQMRYPVAECGVVAVDRKIFVIGGWSGVQLHYLKNMECYDVPLAQWSSLSSMNSCGRWLSAYPIGNWIYAVYNCANYKTYDRIEKYDLWNNKWYHVELNADQSLQGLRSAIVKVESQRLSR